MKKILAFLTAMILVFGLIPVTVSATTNDNLISNGNFENQKTDWKGSSYSCVTDPTDSGQGYVARVDDSSGDRSFIHSSIPLKPNTYYCYSATIYRNSDIGDTYIDILPEGDGPCLAGTLVGTKETGRWVTVSCIFNSGQNTAGRPHLATSKTDDGNWWDSTYYYFDDVMLTELPFPQNSTIGEQKATFAVGNGTTAAWFAATNNGLYITNLSPYITEPQEISLVNRISAKEVTWQYKDYESKSIENGAEHVVTFWSSDEAYQLQAVITQRDDGGLIEFNQYITGRTARVWISYSDIISANIAVKPDGNATLYRFNRSRVNNGKDTNFSQGILMDTLSAGDQIFSTIENGYENLDCVLPYMVLDINGNHGVYFGYYWSFGKILVRMNDEQEVAFTAYLDDHSDPNKNPNDKRIVRDMGEELHVPGFFIGTYEGSVDDGSNQMKDWFWNYKMTQTLRENKNEPYIEIGVLNDQVSGINRLFKIWPDLANYVNILKLDWGWTVPNEIDGKEVISNQRPDLESQWIPEEGYDGNLGLYEALQNCLEADGIDRDVFFSLYMPNTFQQVDIGTKEGRNAQLQALKDRMRPEDNDYGIGYEYWRSDYKVEESYDFDDHEGLLYILDEMIKDSQDFRYEHCSGGGSLKDFTTLERMTFMTTEDTALPLNHRMALYANTYMINPLQLKGDINLGSKDNFYEDSGVGNILESGEPGYTNETYLKYALRTGMLGSMMVSGGGESCYTHEDNLEIFKEHYELYNNTHREILRNTDVYHILPSPDGWNYEDWDGIEYYNHNIDKGVIQLFKENESAPNSKTLRLDGLDENTLYRLTFTDRTKQNVVMSGDELMTAGITVTGMDTQYASEIIYIEPYEEQEDPRITSAVAVNDRQFEITTNEAVLMNGQGWGLFVSEDGEKVESFETPHRYGATISPIGEYTTKFTVTMDGSYNATDIITKAKSEGKYVYLGINGKNIDGMVTTERAHTPGGKGLAVNLTVASHGGHAIAVEPIATITVQSAKLTKDNTIEVEFSSPLAKQEASVLLGVLDETGKSFYYASDANEKLDDHAVLTTKIVDGKLICWLEQDKAGMDTADARNLEKIIDAIQSKFPGHSVGIEFLEPATGTVSDSDLIETVTNHAGAPLRATGSRGTRDNYVIAVSKNVAEIGDTLYETLGEALEAATAEDTIVLMDDVTLKDMVVLLNPDVTLDLNGHELTVNNYLVPFGGIMDSEDGEGKLVIAKDNIKGNLTDNGYLPLYDEGGYRFFKYEFRHVDKKIADADKVQYSVGLGFENKAAYNFLLDDDVEFGVEMAIEKADGEKQYITWVFSDALMQDFVERNTTKRTAITLTISGMASLEDGTTVSAKAILTSEEHALNLAEDMVEKQ